MKYDLSGKIMTEFIASRSKICEYRNIKKVRR